MNFDDIVLWVKEENTIDLSQLSDSERHFYDLCVVKYQIDSLRFKRRKHYNKLKYGSTNKKRAKTRFFSSLESIFSILCLLYQAYNQSLQFKQNSTLITHFQLATYGTLNNYINSKDEKYNHDMDMASKLNKKIKNGISYLKTNSIPLSRENLAYSFVEQLPSQVYTNHELDIFVKLYQFAQTTNHFTVCNRYNRRLPKIIFSGSYIELSQYLSDNPIYTTKERFFMNPFLATLQSGFSNYTEVNELMKFSYAQSFFSTADQEYLKRVLSIKDMSIFYIVIDTLNTLKKGND